jgi:uncharacterized protein (DUF1800 family)
MLTRREFHQGLIVVLAATLAAPKAMAAVADEGEVTLNRLTFGTTPSAREALWTLGLKDWLEAELAKPVSDPALDLRLAKATLLVEYEAGKDDRNQNWPALKEDRPLRWLDATPAELADLLDYGKAIAYEERIRPGTEVIAASLIRAVHADAQLREVMTQFWHDHFSIDAGKDEITATMLVTHDRALREHAFGNFRALLGAMARSPAMLRYLNNDESRASPANENYARELLELHTLGVTNYLNHRHESWHDVPKGPDGVAVGYLDDDVYEVARAFTGWSIGDGRRVEKKTRKDVTGEMEYVEAWHDPYQKRILGVEFPSHQAPMADGERVLDLLADHPGTASFVSRKILRRLGIETPSEAYAARVADVFHMARDRDDQIAEVIRAIVLDPEFAATPPTKVRRPFEFLTAIYRALGTEVSPRDLGFHWQLQLAGWQQHQYGPPTGHPDTTSEWASTRLIAGMVNLALNAHADWLAVTPRRLSDVPEGVQTWNDLAAWWQRETETEPEVIEALMVAYQVPGPDPLPADEPGWIEWGTTAIVAAAMLSPKMIYR